ncbi:MAG: recombinase RecT [Kiritimatiellae bacterium]|nr:recombinase RecT [Kiritimatiellia bacterium]
MKKETSMETAKAALAEKRAAASPAPTAALAVAPRDSMSALQVCQNSANIEALGQTFAASGFFGNVTKSTATAALINCFIEGLSPIEYRAKYHTMEDGSTTIKSDYMQREFRKRGGRWRFNEWTPEVCDVTFFFEGEETHGRVTLDEFKANGVALSKSGQLKTNWAKFPREMLKARCMATYIRAICPEALGGMYTQEEAQDFDRTPAAPRVIAPSAVSPSPIVPEVVASAEVIPPAPADPNVCPCGRAKGKRFDELPSETLERILENSAKFPAITAEHKNAIAAVLGEREAAQ